MEAGADTMTTLQASVLAVLGSVLAFDVGAGQGGADTVEQAKRQVGQVATLCGLVVEYQCKEPERTTLLALDRPLDKTGVSVAIAQSNRGDFDTLFEQRHVLSEVCATGRIEKRRNRYLVYVEKPDQLVGRGSPQVPMAFGAGSFSKCDVGVVLPKLLKEVKPQYTREALAARIAGSVLLEGLVLTTGEIGNIRVLRSLDSVHGLDTEAVRALKAWRFEPGTRDGKPVPVVVTVELWFRLRR